MSGEEVHSSHTDHVRGESKGREIKSVGISMVVIPRSSSERRNDSNSSRSKYIIIALHYFSDGKSL